jgi:hypothetical protein
MKVDNHNFQATLTPMDNAFIAEIRGHLPQDYCATVIWHIARRHGLVLIQDDTFLSRCEIAIAEHILMVGAYEYEKSRSVVNILGDGLPMLVVVCAEAFISNMATGKLDSATFTRWVEVAA